MAKRYNFLTRCLAALALLFVYAVGTSAILVGATTTPAQAWRGGRGRGFYRGGGRGFYRGGFGRGFGFRGGFYPYYGAYYAPRRCWIDPYYGYVCRRAWY